MNVMLAADLRSQEGLVRVLTSLVSLTTDECSERFVNTSSGSLTRLASCSRDVKETELEISQGCIATLIDHRPTGSSLKYVMMLDKTAGYLALVCTTIAAIGDLRTEDDGLPPRIDWALGEFQRLTHQAKSVMRHTVDAVLTQDRESTVNSRKQANLLRCSCEELAIRARRQASGDPSHFRASIRLTTGHRVRDERLGLGRYYP